MSLEAIKSITAAEEKARLDKAEALQNGKRQIFEAETAGTVAVEEARVSAEAEAAKLMSDAEAKAIKYAEELRDNTFNKCAAMRAKAEQKLNNAASFIVRRVVGS